MYYIYDLNWACCQNNLLPQHTHTHTPPPKHPSCVNKRGRLECVIIIPPIILRKCKLQKMKKHYLNYSAVLSVICYQFYNWDLIDNAVQFLATYCISKMVFVLSKVHGVLGSAISANFQADCDKVLTNKKEIPKTPLGKIHVPMETMWQDAVWELLSGHYPILLSIILLIISVHFSISSVFCWLCTGAHWICLKCWRSG